MRTWTRILGILALITLALSITPFGSEWAWGALKPVGAILFGAYFICKLLAPEYAKYNKEHKEQLHSAKREDEQPPESHSDSKHLEPRHA